MKKLAHQERGQSLVIISLAMVGIVAMLALILDVGYVYAQRRLVQNASDAAALGATREVAREGSTDSSVKAMMDEYARRNSPPTGITVVGTYIAPNNAELAPVGGGFIPSMTKGVKVVGETSFSTFFMGVVGLSTGKAGATAVSKFPDPVGPGNWAIWAGGMSNCPSGSVGLNASNLTIVGGIHSNSNMQIGGSNTGVNIVGNVETVSGVQGPNATYAGTVPYPMEGVVEANPFRFRIADFQPGGMAAIAAGGDYHFIQGDLTRTTRDSNHVPYFDTNTNTLRTGLYYVLGDVRFTGGVTGTVTIVSRGVISIKGGDNHITLFQPSSNPCALGGLLLFTDKVSSNLCADSGNVIELTGQENLWAGIIYAPQGRVSVSGSQNGTSTLRGSISAQTVDVSGASLVLQSQEYCPNTGLTGEYLSQ